MLWRLDSGSHVATLVTIVCLAASPILLSFVIAIFAMPAYRPTEINPDVTLMISDLAWIGSMLIWPHLCVAMLMVGIIILKTQGRPESFPAWSGWVSIIAAAIEPFQGAILFTKSGPLAPDGLLTWYAAVFSWGPWILLLSIAMLRILSRKREP